MIKLNKYKVYFIGEVGINHSGSVQKIKHYIDLASINGIDAIKLQLGTPSKFITKENIKRFQLRKKVMINSIKIDELIVYAKRKKVFLFATPITEDYVDFVANKFEVIKIASGDINFLPTLKAANKSKKLTIVSTGASTIHEIENIFKIFKNKKKIILMHCISNYPTEIENANLANIKYLKDKFKVEVGYSNHVLGTTACEVAISMGARIIEFHFTDNKRRKFIDHQISLEPKDFLQLKKKSIEIIKSVGKIRIRQFSCEKNFQELRKGLVYVKNIKKGSILKKEDIAYARPASFFSYDEEKKVLGKKINKDVKKYHLIKKNHLNKS
jgi:N,N'-diacetyllegionaminate synthase